MIILVAAIYAKMVYDRMPEWEKKREEERWEEWEHYETMRNDILKETSDSEYIPKKYRKARPARKKHRL